MLRAFIATMALACLSGSALAEQSSKPSTPSQTFCWWARAALAAAGSEKAAEDSARAQGISEAAISLAKRCPR